ncbi:hypothetical protein FA13DRAFT_1709600 [Coprinellus micaceus]|uniref:Uncharacterized protein n=1 Tax=Coprinellus micaceus TaxID=71717 RepID=A0A4Y7TBX2_COPMI|nr:hypothetical protein FA13DRAFT_1709600 [Coprinellus micaceus]
MSQREAQQGDKPGEPCPGNSILSGASGFSVNQASFVGGNSYKYEGGPTTVQIILDRNVWSGPDPQDGRRSHTSRPQSLDDRFVASESSGHGGTLSKGQSNVLKAEFGGIQSDLELRQREIRRRECEIDEWNARKEEFQRSLLEREQAIKQREQDLSVRILELELREETLQKALARASERESVVEGKELDVERRDVDVNQRYVEVERALKDVEKRESIMRTERRSLAARFTDLKAMEDDIGFRRREEVRKQLGDAAGDLLKYTTIGLQKAFGREAALGVGHVLSHFDFTAIDVGDLKKVDGLRAPLVPLYDKINQRQINSMSDGLKVAFAATVGALQASVALEDPHVDWRVVENILTTTPQLQPVGERVEYREEVEISRELKSSELAIAGQSRNGPRSEQESSCLKTLLPKRTCWT